MTLDPKALEAAWKAVRKQGYSRGQGTRAREEAFTKAYLDDADLVPRGRHLTDDMNDIVLAGIEIEGLTAERDEARQLVRSVIPAQEAKINNLGKQLAALREALESVQDDVCCALCLSVWNTGDTQPHSDKCKAITAALTDTAAAAAQWVRVDDDAGQQLAMLREVLEKIAAETLPRKRFRSFTVMNRGACADMARTALTDTDTAAQYQRVDDEHVVVPVSPTENMADAGSLEIQDAAHCDTPETVWKAMLAAAPQAGEPEGE